MRTAIRLCLSILALSLASCVTTAGPFVTAIAPAGPGKLAVQSCTAEVDAFSGVASTGACTVSVVALDAQSSAGK